MKKCFSIVPALLVVILISFSSCSSIYDVITESVTASGDTLKTDILEIKDILEGDIENLSDSLLTFLEGDRMNALIESAISQASESFVTGLNIDSVLNIVDQNLDQTLAGVLDSLLSENVSNELGLRIKEVLATSGLDPESLKTIFLNDETTEYLVNLKNELLGNSTPGQIDSLMEAALSVFEKYYNQTIQVDIDTLTATLNRINDNLGTTTTKATGVISRLTAWFLGVFLLALGLILGWRIYKATTYSNKLNNLVVTIAGVINEIPDQKTYDEVTKKIKEITKTKDLDGLLDDAIKPLKEKSAKEWQNKDNQVLKLLSKHLAQGNSALESFSGNNLNQIKEEAKELGLEHHLKSVLERYGK